MPNFTMTLPESDQAITRPVIVGMVKQIQDICRIADVAEIFFPGDLQAMQVAGTDIDGAMQERFAKFESNRITFIDIEETYDPQALSTTAVSREEYAPIFEDEKLGVKVCPVYATTDIRINVRYRTPSKTEAKRWHDDMRMRISQLRDVNLHKAKYHFNLPEQIGEILEHIYDKREAVAGYGETLGKWVEDHMTERLTVIADQVGKNNMLAISESQTRIQGQFDIDALPEKPERDEKSGTYTVSFSYKFSYEKPIGMNFVFPVMIHNQLLDLKYVGDLINDYDPAEHLKSYSKSMYAFSTFEMNTLMKDVAQPDPYLRIPRYDDFIIPQTPQGTGTAVMALMEVGADKKELFNLKEMGDICIDGDILKFIQEVEWPYICKQFKSVLQLTLYKGKYQQSTGNLVCDQNLNISARDELDYRTIHRVHIGVCTDLTLLPKEAIERLRNHPKALLKIIKSMNELLQDHPLVNKLGDKTRLTTFEFSDLYAVLTGYGYNNGVTGRSSEFFNAHPNQYPILRSIDPRVVKFYRDNTISRKTVMEGYIAAYSR